MRFSFFALPLLILSGLSLATPTRDDQATPARALSGDLADAYPRADNVIRGDAISGDPMLARRSFQVTIAMLTGSTISLTVNPDDTFAIVKGYIFEVENIPTGNQRLIWQGRPAPDSQTLTQAGVGPGATITLVLAVGSGSSSAPAPSGGVARARGRNTAARAQVTSLSRRSFQVTITRVSDGSSIQLTVNPTDTFAIVKDDIEAVEGIPPANQRLIWLGKAPSDSQTLEQAGVGAGDTIYLVLALGGSSTAPTPSGAVKRVRAF
ncbi:UBL domain-containing protein [Phanerochaete sordida]|uniref:UBL domain-containing protein n=1 Tax=Phanerochaete sordida TaxID=48140 RepID=A0A9P3L8V4_9APHY|nr:UBL domain-containing protein [Phanerochaete sordida]